MTVALRKESVDRNDPPIKAINVGSQSLSARRAWIEIVLPGLAKRLKTPSLSARRAWIEILTPARMSSRLLVALRKESVDRNPFSDKNGETHKLSLSARRAWIEMRPHHRFHRLEYVALRKESVDRNANPVLNT